MSSHQHSSERRRLLQLGLGGIGVAALGGLSLKALAQTHSSQSAEQGADESHFASFMSLSVWLLSDKTLDERLGQRFFEALVRITVKDVPGMGSLPGLKRKLLALGEQRDRLTEDDITEGEMALIRRLLQAWMLGTVGQSMSDPQAEVIAFEHAAMYAGPRDVQVIRTYCPDRPGFWAEQPAL